MRKNAHIHTHSDTKLTQGRCVIALGGCKQEEELKLFLIFYTF